MTVAAIVLAGGTSARMGGADKTAAPVAGATVLDTLVASLPAAWPVVCVGVPRPLSRDVTWTREDPPLGGPVAGLAAGLERVGDADVVVVLAGDQPFAGPAADLVARALGDAHPDVDGVAAAGPDGRPQPLLAAYRADSLRRVLPADARDTGVHRSLAALRVVPHAVADEATLDVDTPADLGRARRIARD